MDIAKRTSGPTLPPVSMVTLYLNYELHDMRSFSSIESGVASTLTGTMMENMTYLIGNSTKTIAIRNVETLNLIPNIPCDDLHVYHSFEGSDSYSWHSDEKYVLIYMSSGQKIFHTPKEIFTLKKNDWLWIPKGLPHRAETVGESILLSFGRARD